MKHDYLFQVRGYELDSFGHVNNSVYLNYLEEARWIYFNEQKWMDYLREYDLFPVIIETNIKYIRELKMFDKAVVKTQWFYDGAYLITKQEIFIAETNKKIAKATGKLALVSKDRIIHEIPEFIKKQIKEV